MRCQSEKEQKKKGKIMKRIRLFVALGGGLLLLLTLLLLTTCRGDRTDGETDGSTASETTDGVTSEDLGTGSDTTPSTETDSAEAEARTEAKTEVVTPHQTEEDPDTEKQTEPPVTLTAEEAKALLSAALEKGMEQVAVTLRTERNGDTVSQESFARRGEDFCVELREDGITEGITVVGSRAYYLLLVPKDFPPVEKRFVTSLTDRERENLFLRYMHREALPVMEDDELIEGILNGELEGVRHSDGTVELTSRGLDGSLGEGLFGISLEGSELRFEFLLDREVRVTLMRGTAYRSGGEGSGLATVSVEMTVNYTPSAIGLPADATLYAPTTYDEIFGVQPPEADPEAAAASGMPLDRDHYTLIGGNYLYDPSEQYAFLTQYPHAYAGKTFVLYGVLTNDGSGGTALSLGSGMELALAFGEAPTPVEGAYIKVTATYRKVAEGEDLHAYAMGVTACEVLGEAKGPNGGKLLYVASAGLNVRTSSDVSVSDNVIGAYSKGDLVEVFEQNGDGWYRVVYNGQNGYVNGKYLSETRP